MKTSLLFCFLIHYCFSSMNAQTSIDDEGNRVTPDVMVVYPKCKGDNMQLLKCFNKKLQMHMVRNMRLKQSRKSKITDSTTKKMFLVFGVDKKGNIVNLKVKAPSVRLEKEGLRVLKLLPIMKRLSMKVNLCSQNL